eukprot:357320-Chlamydomonas_euryale.AAC.2
MAGCNSPFLVRLRATAQDNDHVFFMMDAVLGGELFAFLQVRGSRQSQKVSQKSIYMLFWEAAGASTWCWRVTARRGGSRAAFGMPARGQEQALPKGG